MRKIINSETAEVREVDHYAYWGEGLPDDFVELDSITEDMWIKALQDMKERNSRDEWT